MVPPSCMASMPFAHHCSVTMWLMRSSLMVTMLCFRMTLAFELDRKQTECDSDGQIACFGFTDYRYEYSSLGPLLENPSLLGKRITKQTTRSPGKTESSFPNRENMRGPRRLQHGSPVDKRSSSSSEWPCNDQGSLPSIRRWYWFSTAVVHNR